MHLGAAEHVSLDALYRAQVDDELDGGKVNGSEVDPRLAALLADFPQDVAR